MGRAFEYRRASKEKRWDKMSKLFPKLARTITVAAKEGGIDPEANSKLRAAIQNAKVQNMPKDNIETAIRRAAGKDAADFVEINYEGKGPHGALFFVECATDNTNRSVTNVRTAFNKAGGALVQTGSLEFLFDRKTLIEFPVSGEMALEDIELELIDSGLEELEVNEGTAFAYADYRDFRRLSEGIEKLGIKAGKAVLQRVPTSPQEFTEEQLVDIEALIDKLEDDEDVQGVFTNVS